MTPGQPARRLFTTLLASVFLIALSGASSATLAISDEEFEDTVGKIEKQLKLKTDLARWTDGSPVIVDAATGLPVDGPGVADATHLAYAVVELKKPMIKALDKRVRAKATEPVIGNQAGLKAGQRVLVLVVATADPLTPGVPGGVQGLLGFNGADGVPSYPGGSLDPLAGNETVVLFGQWPEHQQLLTATTPLAGLAVGGAPEWNSADALAYGYNQDQVWVLLYPVPEGAGTFDLRMQGIAGNAQVIDLFTTAHGLDEFALGGSPASGDFCVSGFSFAQQDADGGLTGHEVEFTFSPGAPFDAQGLEAFTFVGVDGGDPLPVSVEVFEETGSAFVTLSAEPGTYRVGFDGLPIGGDGQVLSPDLFGGGAIVDLTGPRSGQFFGTLPCGLLPSVEGGIPEAALAAMADAIGLDASGFEPASFRAPDGTDVRALIAPGAQGPAVVMTASDRPASVETFDGRVAASPCDERPLQIGSKGIYEVCTDGTIRLYSLQLFESDEGPRGSGRLFSVEVSPGGFPDGSFPLDEDPFLTADDQLRPEVEDAFASHVALYMEAVPNLAPPEVQ